MHIKLSALVRLRTRKVYIYIHKSHITHWYTHTHNGKQTAIHLRLHPSDTCTTTHQQKLTHTGTHTDPLTHTWTQTIWHAHLHKQEHYGSYTTDTHNDTHTLTHTGTHIHKKCTHIQEYTITHNLQTHTLHTLIWRQTHKHTNPNITIRTQRQIDRYTYTQQEYANTQLYT